MEEVKSTELRIVMTTTSTLRIFDDLTVKLGPADSKQCIFDPTQYAMQFAYVLRHPERGYVEKCKREEVTQWTQELRCAKQWHGKKAPASTAARFGCTVKRICMQTTYDLVERWL